MEKTIFMKKLQKMKLVAHRLGYQMTSYPENSLEVIQDIFKDKKKLNACFGFEFDICFTKDHIPVVIHDKYIDDISDSYGLIKTYTLNELKKITFGFRKSKNNKSQHAYKIITLEELLNFFNNNINLLEDKIIKIETKDYFLLNKKNFSKTNLKKLAQIINKYPKLANNLVHLSFWPLNLLYLKRIQKKFHYQITKNDLLCDQNFMVIISKLLKSIDNISLRIKEHNIPKTSKNYSKRVNRKIKRDLFFMKFSNTINEKNLNYAIKRFGSVNLYTLNTHEEINELCKNISTQFFNNYFDKIIITTNNPIKIKTT